MIRRKDDTGSLAFAMLLTLVGISLTALLVPLIATQAQSNHTDTQHLVALSAAQTGLDVAVDHVQATKDGLGNGDIKLLPCGSFTGAVTSGGARYQVTIVYYATGSDPQGHENDTAWQQAHPPMACPGHPTSTPSYALLRAQGTDQATGPFTGVRSLFATYVFKTSNQPIAGGLIRTYGGGPQLCLGIPDAAMSPTGVIVPGTSVTAENCDSTKPTQIWAYTPNLNLVLVKSNPQMCVDSGAATETTANLPVMEPCISPKAKRQIWSLDDSSYFEGTTDGVKPNGLCLRAGAAGNAITMTGCSTNWAPDATVGAGADGPATGQLVNFLQFGRCLDITNQDETSPYAIAWPCKQYPDPSKLTWNQVFLYPTAPQGPNPAVGSISTTPNPLHNGTSNTKPYCLTSPNSTAPLSNYPTLEVCTPASPKAAERWSFYGNTGVWATSYIITDQNGYCLAPTDQNATPADLFNGGVKTSKITVTVCDGSKLQKWNADPQILQSLPLSNMGEN